MIQETNCLSKILEKISSKCWQGFQSIDIDADGDSGDFPILWHPLDIILKHLFYTRCSLSTNFQIVGKIK